MTQARQPALLVIDDDIQILDVLRRTFFDQPWSMFRARSAEEAEHILREHPIDTVLCDYYLPDTNGLELVSRIRDRYPSMPCILLTGTQETEPIQQAQNDSLIHSFHEKPWNDDTLIQAIQDSLETSPLIKTPVTKHPDNTEGKSW